ncbi:hypothetical protein BLGI_387 [Brevibacillus laterosporus GI-9]|nr:hypothetical protein BLGI_387 [Brevibacillus laterosporus GI-9]
MLGHACSSVFSTFHKERLYGLLAKIAVRNKKMPVIHTGIPAVCFMDANSD